MLVFFSLPYFVFKYAFRCSAECYWSIGDWWCKLSQNNVNLYSWAMWFKMLQRELYSLDIISDSFKLETTCFTKIMLYPCRLIGLHIWNILHQFCSLQGTGWFCRSTTEKDIFTHRRANLIKNQAGIQTSAITFTATLLNLLCKFEKLAKCFPQPFGPSSFCRGKQRRKTLFKYLPYLQTLQDDYFSNHHSPKHHTSPESHDGDFCRFLIKWPYPVFYPFFFRQRLQNH